MHVALIRNLADIPPEEGKPIERFEVDFAGSFGASLGYLVVLVDIHHLCSNSDVSS